MIRLLTGKLARVLTESCIVDVYGVGYEVWIGPRLAQNFVTTAPSEVSLEIYMHVKEDAQQLFGFQTPSARELFVLLIGVSGVGPKTALHVMDQGESAVADAIRVSDVAFFQKVPRLGKKSAQKIIVELQSKVGKLQELDLSPESTVRTDVREALVGMGYPESTVREVLQELDETLPVAFALKWALKELNARRGK